MADDTQHGRISATRIIVVAGRAVAAGRGSAPEDDVGRLRVRDRLPRRTGGDIVGNLFASKTLSFLYIESVVQF